MRRWFLGYSLFFVCLIGFSVWFYDYSTLSVNRAPKAEAEYVVRYPASALRLPTTTLSGQFVFNAGDQVVDPGLRSSYDGSTSLIQWTNALGDLITTPYIQANHVDIAPKVGAATWFGSGSVTDGYPTHFHGHTPGDFYWLFDVQIGDVITITDDNGNVRDYTVIKRIDSSDQGIDREGHYVMDQVLNIEGEMINLQTCYDEDWNLIVQAVPEGGGLPL